MPYVGNPLANAFSSREKQDLTGQSGTSFTLSHAVSSPNDLSVYINHVRQEPTTAYTVNGTALTTTGSVAGTDDFYIIYDELAVQSISHPTNQALTATSGTFTSGLVGTTATFSGAGSFAGATTLTGGISNFAIITGGVEQEYELGGTNYRSHSFLNAGPHRFSTSTSLTVDFLIVGGGGGSAPSEGNNGSTGGAGAGGLVEGTSQTLAPGNYAITVGAGGAKSTSLYAPASNGGDSTFNGFTAKGGGGSGDYGTAGSDGGNGAGGSESQQAGGATTQDTYSGTTNVTGYGNAGGPGAAYPSGGAGSGGGAGGAGQGANNTNIAGGAGRANNFRTGNNITYAQGGSGATGLRNSVVEGGANTGNGAGGVSKDGGSNLSSANGSAGIVVIRYAV